MTSNKTLIKQIVIHILGFVTASIAASSIAGLVLNTVNVASENGQFTIKGLISLSAIVVVFLYINHRFNEPPVNFRMLFSRAAFISLIAGLVSISLVLTVLFSLDLYSVVSYQENPALVMIALALGAQAFSQEVLFRGILFRQLTKRYQVLYVAMALSLLLAGLNVLVQGFSLLSFVAVLMMDFILVE